MLVRVPQALLSLECQLILPGRKAISNVCGLLENGDS